MTHKTQKILILSFIALMLSSMIIGFVAHNAIENYSEKNLLSSTTPTDWILGQSVSISYNAPTSIVSSVVHSGVIAGLDITSYVYMSNDAEMIKDDGTYCIIYYESKNIANAVAGTSTFKIKAKGLAGTLYYELGGETSTGTYQTYDTTKTITSEHSNLEGDLLLSLTYYYSSSVATMGFYLGIYNFEDKAFENLFNYGIGASGTFTIKHVRIDQLTFEPDDISQTIRSYYLYNSETSITHKLLIDNYDYGTSIKIYKPIDWIYSSVNPSATATLYLENIYLTNTIPTTYEVLFTSSTSLFLNLKDVTDQCLYDVGFETGEWENDWYEQDSYVSGSISQQQVSEGYFSLFIEVTAGQRYLRINPNRVTGECFITFDYFLNTTLTNDLYFAYYNRVWTYIALDEDFGDETNKWHKAQYNVTLTENSAFNLGFATSTGGLSFFLDNFRIYKPDVVVNTIGKDKYSADIGFVNLDGYQNPSASFLDIYVQLADRTSGEILDIQNATTNEAGRALVIFNEALYNSEYVIYAYSFGKGLSMMGFIPFPSITLIDIDSTGDQDFRIAPTNFNDGASLWLNEIDAYDWDNGTNADLVSTDDTADLEFNTWTYSTGGINYVDLYARVDASGLVNDYITVKWFVSSTQGTGTFEINSANQASDMIISFENLVDPIDASWTWTDIINIVVTFDVEKVTGSDACTIGIDEVWGWVDTESLPEDTTPPEITSPADDEIEFGSTTDQIQWDGGDANPNNYIVWRNETNVQNGVWDNDSYITIELDGLAVGLYNFTCWLDDDSSNTVTDTVWITVSDTTSPILDSPSDDQYAEGSTGNTITWTATDLSPNAFTVYKNSTTWDTGTWTSGVGIEIDIDGLSLGWYNFTIDVSDDWGHNDTDTVFIHVVDETYPVLNSPSDIQYPYLSSGNEISWTITEVNEDYYFVWRNGTEVDSGTYSSGVPIVVDIDGLAIGYWNYTIWCNDTTGLTDFDTVFVTVYDGENPFVVSDSGEADYEFGYSSATGIWWYLNDTIDNEGTYIIYRNGTEIGSGSWYDGVIINPAITGLAVGAWNFTILFYDLTMNSNTSTLWCFVYPATNPIIHEAPEDDEIEFGSTSINLTWNATDDYAYYWYVYYNGTLLDSGSWTSGVDIIVSIDEILDDSICVWNITLLVSDLCLYNATDTVWITIYELTPPNLDSPSDAEYSYTAESDITWTATDTFAYTFVVYRNGTLFDSGSWTSGVPIVVDISNLYLLGVFNFTIIVFDESLNNATDTVFITFYDSIDPVLQEAPEDDSFEFGSTGNTLDYNFTDDFNYTYILYKNSTEFDSGNWVSGEWLIINIDSLGLGLWNMTIIAFDSSMNFVIDLCWIEVYETPDTDPPSIDSPDDDEFAEGSTGNTISWNATDENADSFLAYYNGTLFDSGSYVSGVLIVVEIDFLPYGYWNITIWCNDTGGYYSTDTVFVLVYDGTDPTLSSPADDEIELGSTGETISWIPIDDHNTTYQLYRNDTLVDSGNWDNYTAIIISLNGLAVGLYNFTIIIFDIDSNFAIDLVWIIVSDTTAPNMLDIENDPDSPTQLDSVTIYVTITDLSDVFNATVFWRIDGGSWFYALMSNVSDLYDYELGTFSVGEQIDYYIVTYDIYFNDNTSDTYYFIIVSANPPPVIDNITYDPLTFDEDDYINIRCSVEDTDDLVSCVILYFYYSYGDYSAVLYYAIMTNESGNIYYNLDIGTFYAYSSVSFYIWANDTLGNYGVSETYLLRIGHKFFGYYFSPEDPRQTDYATEELKDCFDYSEDRDGYATSLYCTTPFVINGFLNFTKSSFSGNYYSVYSATGLSIDTDYYSLAEIRCRIVNYDASNDWRFYLALYTPAFDFQGTPQPLNETWHTFQIPLEAGKLGERVRFYIYEFESNITAVSTFQCDYIRFVRTTESYAFESDTTLGICSDDNNLRYAIYSDGNYLGLADDVCLVPFNLTYGDHFITWIPIARVGEIKAFAWCDLYYYGYEVLTTGNYYTVLDLISIDTVNGKFYIDLMTYDGTVTYRLADNDTWLGSAVGEGASVWDFTSNAGYHNFTIWVYDGVEVWDVIIYGFYINPRLLDVRITYLTYFGNKIDFDNFETFVTTTELDNASELDGYTKMTADENITILTYSNFGFLLHNGTYAYSEALFITLNVHYVSFYNLNTTRPVAVSISWELGDMVGNFTFTLEIGTFSEQYLIYRDGHYYLFFNADGYEALNLELDGYDIAHGTIALNLSSSSDLVGGLTWQTIVSWTLTIGGGFGFMWGLFNNIAKIEDNQKRRIWSSVFFGLLLLVAIVSYLISGMAWQPLILMIVIVIATILWIRKEGIILRSQY